MARNRRGNKECPTCAASLKKMKPCTAEDMASGWCTTFISPYCPDCKGKSRISRRFRMNRQDQQEHNIVGHRTFRRQHVPQDSPRRAKLIDTIVANTAITREAAQRFNFRDLEAVANGVHGATLKGFSQVLGADRLPESVGRVESVELADEDNDEAVQAMMAHTNIRHELCEERSRRTGREYVNHEAEWAERRARAVSPMSQDSFIWETLVVRGLLPTTRQAPPHELQLADEYRTGRRRVTRADLGIPTREA